MSRKDEVFKSALVGKNIPILTLDNKWHRLFTQTDISPKIKKKQEELNDLLKKQGKLHTDVKSIKKLKTKLMDEIVASMGDDERENAGLARKKEENRRLIEECNEKIEDHQDELFDVEREINEVNYELMLLSMEVCYDVIGENTQEIEEIGKWINQVRIDLKKNVVRKQEKEYFNQELYSYMHDIFGPEVIEIFDMKYNPSDMMLRKKKPLKMTLETKKEAETNSENV